MRQKRKIFAHMQFFLYLCSRKGFWKGIENAKFH